MTSNHQLNFTNLFTSLKLASMWASFMFFYVYVDYFALYMPNNLVNIQNGFIYKFSISPSFLIIALISVSIPILMIFLSVCLPHRINKILNIIIAIIYIPYSLFNLIGENWMHMYYGAIIEIVILSLIIKCAWNWRF